MDATEIESFCATAAQLVPQLMECGALLPAERKPKNDALLRQLRIAAAALAATCYHVARLMPPMPMPAQPRPTSVHAPS